MRLLFAGTPAAAVPALTELIAADGHEVVAVLTRPPAPAGRGRRVEMSPVGLAAEAAGIEVLSPPGPSDAAFLARLAELDVDCAPVVAYGALLREPALGMPRRGWVNLHFSLLPAWRGAAPVQHAILHGDEFTGASTFQIGPGLDDGPVFGVLTERVQPADTAGDLLARLAQAGAGLLRITLDGIEDGSLRPVPQLSDGVSLAPKLTTQDAFIDFTQSATAVSRRSRACSPAPGAWTWFRGERIKLGPIGPAPAAESATDPGAGRLSAIKGGVLVSTATLPVMLSSVQSPGRRPIPAADWFRGARPADGDVLGR
jgi:methionyl-tRNA formyltransferase